MAKNETLSAKYNEQWRKIQKKILAKKKLDRDPIFDDKYLKTKINTYNNNIAINAHGKTPKEGISAFVCQ